MNNVWCSGAVKVGGLCSPEIEFLMLRCRPFYLLREFISVYIVAVDIPTWMTRCPEKIQEGPEFQASVPNPKSCPGVPKMRLNQSFE